jgi:GTP-binding protein HflX
MGDSFSTAEKTETAVLIALINQTQNERTTKEHLEELAFLAETLGVETVHMFTQQLAKPDVRSFVGKGKLEEIDNYVQANNVDIVIFDDDLTPSQLRNIENSLKCKVYDRSLLILDIFLKRAQTAQAKTQVELARFQYLLPRLTRMWTHLERQRGGTGTRGGAGEKEIETDRRAIRNQITVLKQRLEKIERQGRTQRKSRGNIVRAALVGYTNVGKSTLMTLLSKSDVYAENKLFATVDATIRKVNFQNIPFLLSDTVGFIRKLPTHLIESFKSTLDEIREADILLHVVDISHPAYEEQIEVVNNTLADIGAINKSMIMVLNKIDLYREQHPDREERDPFEVNEDESPQTPTLEDLKRMFIAHGEHKAVFISAEKKENIDELREVLFEEVKKKHYTIFPNYLKTDY